MGAGEQPEVSHEAPDLHPPGTVPEVAAANPGSYRGLIIALTVIMLLVLGVVFLLPQMVTETPTDEERSALPAPVIPVQTPSQTNITAIKSEVQQALESYLQLRAKLELDNAGAWGEPEWSQAAQAASAGDGYFSEQKFAPAARSYQSAVDTLEALDNSKAERLDAALNAGWQSLEINDAEASRTQFERALVIEPGHELAQKGLERASVRDEVMRHMENAGNAETNGDLAEARSAYSQAMNLDAEYEAAREGFVRVSDQITDIAFRDAMSRALAALDAGRLEDAGIALKAAQRLKPDDASVSDTRQRLARARQWEKLDRLRGEADAMVEKEDWQGAVAKYKKVTEVDASAGFALDGLAHAADRALLHKQLDHYLSKPDRLSSPEPLVNAQNLLRSAGDAPANEPKLAQKLAILKKEVARARTPVQVSLRSDGETNVVIYHVARLGQFQERQLDITPGTYTVVGSRPGYRDVRKKFTVQPGASPPILVIRCEEPI